MAALVIAVCLPVFAQQFADVPTDHWAYAAIQQLAKDGVIVGYPDGTFGGKRAMTRYEFAQALARAIPGIESVVKSAVATGTPGPQGPEGPAGPAGPQGPVGPAGPGTTDIDTMQKLVNEFRDELASLGVDVAGLKKDLAALNQRVAAVEAEQRRVVFNGELNVVGRGEISNTNAGPNTPTSVDRDFRLLSQVDTHHIDSPLATSRDFENFALKIKGRVSDDVSINSTIMGGNYLAFALTPNNIALLPSQADQFTLWDANIDGSVDLGFLGRTEVKFGRFPFQLTPYTLKFINPDSYTPLPVFTTGDFQLDGIEGLFKFGSTNLTVFASKPTLGENIAGPGSQPFMLEMPALNIPGTTTPGTVTSMGGGRMTIPTPLDGSLGLTYFRFGLGVFAGQTNIYGGDLRLNLGGLEFCGEWDQSNPTNELQTSFPPLNTNNDAWNANLKYQWGNLGLAAGYMQIGGNYTAPGYWDRMGIIVNPTNVQGIKANLTYAFNPDLKFDAEGQFLQPAQKDNTPLNFRTASTMTDPVTDAGLILTGADINQINYYRAGLKYGLTAVDNVDLGYEDVQITGTGTGNAIEAGLTGTTESRFVTFGYGHSFSPNMKVKLLYSIFDPIFNNTTVANERGGIIAAQFMGKF
jgi:hypothetical protein